MNTTTATLRSRITAATTLALGAGAVAIGALAIAPAAHAAGPMTFEQACLITKGRIPKIPAAGIEECHWQDPDGNEHVISNPLPIKKVPVGPVTQPPVRQ